MSRTIKSLLILYVVILAVSRVDSRIELENNGTNRPRLTKRQAANGCSYSFQFKNPGDSAYLTSPNYPGEYPPNVDCRYTISSPVGTTMTMECSDFNVEPSSNCQYDVFFLSLTGDQTFSDQEYYCGAGTLNRTTRGNQLTIGFHSDDSNPKQPASSPNFRFRCLLTVRSAVQPTPTCSCGLRNEAPSGRIVGGTDASVGEFPWRCALYTLKNGVFCACTIISANWVLTAAHCTRSVESGDQIYVNVGDYDLSSTTDTENQLIPVSRVVENALYNDQTQDADASLLRLSRTLTFSRNISPVCLPWRLTATDLNNANVVASGWGTQYFAGPTSSTLKKVNLKVVGTSQCRQMYQQQAAANTSPITITDNMICTYTPGRDTCQGDSGGSIDYNSDGRYYAVGIVSQGVGCGSDHPGVYTKISNYLRWIQGNTGETFC